MPPGFDLKRKAGFGIPLAKWLKQGPYRELFWDVLTSNSCVFNKHYSSTLLRGQDKGMGNSERLFGLVQFELWRQEYNISI